MTAVLLALLGIFSVEGVTGGVGGDDDDYLANILDEEIDNLYNDVSGGDSRHHGRIASSENANKRTNKTRHQNLLDRTAALIPPTLDPSHVVLSHRRYSVCISDLKCVLNVDGMARHFASFPTVVDVDGKQIANTSAQGAGVADYLTMRQRDNNDCALDDWIKVSERRPIGYTCTIELLRLPSYHREPYYLYPMKTYYFSCHFVSSCPFIRL